ncbi:MAG: hypothetical protein ACRDY7_01125 [Acidimicrobiia bacterium]
MALRDKLRERAQEFLEPGEQIQQVFPAQTGNPLFVLIPILLLLKVRYRVVAVTDRAVVVLSAPWWWPYRVTGLVSRLERSTPLVLSPGNMGWGTVELGEVKLYVQKRFHEDVEAAAGGLGGLATA